MTFMEKINPLWKMGTILISAVLMMFNTKIILNITVFAVCMILILFFSKGSKKKLIITLMPIVIVMASLFMAGYKNADQGAVLQYAIGSSPLGSFIDNIPVYTGLQLSTRVLGYVGLGLLFALTTPPYDFILSMMHQGHIKPKFAYGILAAYHLIPTIGEELEDAKLAFKVRGIKVSPFSMKPFFAAMVNCIRWSENLAMAMESKGFDGDGERTFSRVLKTHVYDGIFAVVLPVFIFCGLKILPL